MAMSIPKAVRALQLSSSFCPVGSKISLKVCSNLTRWRERNREKERKVNEKEEKKKVEETERRLSNINRN